MVAAAKMQRARRDEYLCIIDQISDVSHLREMEQFHIRSIAAIKRRIATIDPQRHPLAGKPPFSERSRRPRQWDEGIAICCLAFSTGLVFLAGLSHVGRLIWDAITG